MGCEVRMVPPNWEHPKGERGNLIPMHDESFAVAAAQWKTDLAKWEAGERPEYCTDESRALEFWEWESGPPHRDDHRPWEDQEATWFQLWETVTEGTPISPPFPTREALAEHLAKYGDNWEHQPWGKAKADAFVAAGWAPTGMVMNGRWIGASDIPLEQANIGLQK